MGSYTVSSLSAGTSTSMFQGVVCAKQSSVAKVVAEFQSDLSPRKVDLMFGNYRDESGTTLPMEVVKTAEQAMKTPENLPPIPVTGQGSFSSSMAQLITGDPASGNSLHIAAVQTVSGTSALYLVARLLKQRGTTAIYLSEPTSSYHEGVLFQAGITVFRGYRYCHHRTKSLDWNGMVNDLKAAPLRSVVLLQPCGHNPTGVNPTRDQWQGILEVIKENQLLPLWDCSFQGLASGDVDVDAWPVKRCVDLGIEFFCVQTTENTFRLNNGVGNLAISAGTADQLEATLAQAAEAGQETLNNSSEYAARIVRHILSDSRLTGQWKLEVKGMAHRMRQMRALLREKLEDLRTPGTWSFITEQAGLFMYSGLTAHQCGYVRRAHHVYLPDHGCINVSGINQRNVDQLAFAVYDVVTRDRVERATRLKGNRSGTDST